VRPGQVDVRRGHLDRSSDGAGEARGRDEQQRLGGEGVSAGRAAAAGGGGAQSVGGVRLSPDEAAVVRAAAARWQVGGAWVGRREAGGGGWSGPR
jgi:hypothetical protein